MIRRMLESLAQDLRYSFRGLRKSPGFALVATLSLLWGAGVAFVLAAGVGGWRALRGSRMQQQEDERAERAEDDDQRQEER